MELEDYLSQLKSGIDDAFKQAADFSSSIQKKGMEERRALFCPECGTRLPADAHFCMECGCNIAEYMSGNGCNKKHDKAVDGIIWTDTKKLAEKYDEEESHVVGIFEDFIAENDELGVNWVMLDMADRQKELGEATWMDYSEVLQNFMKQNNIPPSSSLALFIVGGYDVIPQPCEENPSGDGTPYDSHVYADFYYCFYGQLNLELLDYTKARCNVARLPLETGSMETSIVGDIVNYFYLSNLVSKNGGINIGRAVMTSNADWIPASREMSRNLPTDLLEDKEGVTLDNMFISPEILAEMDEDIASEYYEALEKANMLVFNLHGSCDPEDSGFYSCDLAFEASMLERSFAKIFNTVACWGARYINYARDESMLLSAIYEHEVLLYSGACVPALGKCGNFNLDDTWRIQPIFCRDCQSQGSLWRRFAKEPMQVKIRCGIQQVMGGYGKAAADGTDCQLPNVSFPGYLCDPGKKPNITAGMIKPFGGQRAHFRVSRLFFPENTPPLHFPHKWLRFIRIAVLRHIRFPAPCGGNLRHTDAARFNHGAVPSLRFRAMGVSQSKGGGANENGIIMGHRNSSPYCHTPAETAGV